MLLHLEIGDKESRFCWEAFLEDMKQRRLKTPLLTAMDGNAGCRRAVKSKLPVSLVQRCQVHKMRNIMKKLPQVARPALKRLIYKVFTAKTYAEGLRQSRAIVAQYQKRFRAAMKCLAQDLEECLTALKLPYAHRRQTRTTNVLEQLFGEGKRRSKIIARFTSEDSGLALMFAVLLDAADGWHGLRMNDALRARLQVMRTAPDSAWNDPDLNDVAA